MTPRRTRTSCWRWSALSRSTTRERGVRVEGQRCSCQMILPQRFGRYRSRGNASSCRSAEFSIEYGRFPAGESGRRINPMKISKFQIKLDPADEKRLLPKVQAIGKKYGLDISAMP